MNISDVLIVNSLNTISVNCKQQQVVRIIINTSSMVLYVPYRTQPWKISSVLIIDSVPSSVQSQRLLYANCLGGGA